MDAPATPTSIQFNDPPRSYQVENFAIGLENPINIESIKRFFSNSILLKLPRFTSLLVTGRNGRHYWKPTQVDINRHFKVIRHSRGELNEEADEVALNGYLADLAAGPVLDANKPLWEIHVLLDLRALVLRAHHSVGDGTSMASLIREIGRDSVGGGEKEEVMRMKNPWSVSGCLFTVVYAVVGFVKLFVLREKKTVLNDKEYVENWSQKLATARFNLDSVKLVKNLVPKATINDIFCGVIWSGFIKYINARSSTGLKEGQQIIGLLAANLRAQSGLMDVSKLMQEGNLEYCWGNIIGYFLLPLSLTKDITDPVDYVRKAKYILDKKKSSMESYIFAYLRNLILHLWGQKALTDVTARICNSTTFLFSNVVGPSEQISIAGNPVTYLRVSCSSSPMRIIMHLMSYKKNLDLQILVAEDVIPDPKFLANCFQNAFKEMESFVDETRKSGCVSI